MKVETTEFIHGDRPRHVHRFNDNGQEVEIECNSPYCGDSLNTDPRQLTPIIQGREPWRGR